MISYMGLRLLMEMIFMKSLFKDQINKGIIQSRIKKNRIMNVFEQDLNKMNKV